MANKDFTTDAADIFVTKFSQEPAQAERPQQGQERKPQEKKPTRTASQGQERICIMMDSAIMEEVRAIAYYDRMKIVDIFRNAVEDYITKYEKKNGKIQGR